MRKLHFVFLFFLAWFEITAQQSPYHIRNFNTHEYGGFNQTWQAVQNDQGILFLGSSSCVYTYDGIDWKQTLVKRGAATRQIHHDSISKNIYVGSVADFGCLEQDSTILHIALS